MSIRCQGCGADRGSPQWRANGGDDGWWSVQHQVTSPTYEGSPVLTLFAAIYCSTDCLVKALATGETGER